MKNHLLILLSLLSLLSFSQEKKELTSPNNQVFLNSINLIVFKSIDISYEHALNQESSIGLSLLGRLLDDKKDNYIAGGSKDYAITPYYRHYFSNKYSTGFFMEFFTMFHGGRYREYIGSENYYLKKYTSIASGLGIGTKFVLKNNLVGVISMGAGRNLFHDTRPHIVIRPNISLGYKF